MILVMKEKYLRYVMNLNTDMPGTSPERLSYDDQDPEETSSLGEIDDFILSSKYRWNRVHVSSFEVSTLGSAL